MRALPLSVFSAVFGSVAAAPLFAQTDVWALLEDVGIEEIVTADSYEVRKSFPQELEDGIEELTITGYAMPIPTDGLIEELMLVSDMGNCPLCGSADHGASLQVKLATPMPFFEDGARITLKGALKAVKDPTTWQSAVMENAVVTEL